MRSAFRRAVVLALAVLTAVLAAPMARAQDKPTGSPLQFTYHDVNGFGVLSMDDLGPISKSEDPKVAHQIQVTLRQNGLYYYGSGISLQLEETMPFRALVSFTLLSRWRSALHFEGTMISGITVSASGIYFPVVHPERKAEWSIVLGAPGPATSGIRGVADRGPIFPHERPGIPNTAPMADAIIIIQPAGGGPEITRTRTDQNGRFEIALPPGTYRLVPLPPDPNAVLPRAAPQDVTVKPGQFTQVTVHFDTGIR